jgi:A/G-specific adenine glycosylase
MAMTPRDLTSFRRALNRWYRAHGRHDLPWRQTRDPYAVLVSEVMLQQTQVSRVLLYYERWISRWPDVASLAAAAPAEVIRAWSGLGYNRRALHLHRTALAVAGDRGDFPEGIGQLEKLPGIGRYTAGAVACFANGQRTTVTDTNISRVLARVVMGMAAPKDATAAELSAAAEALLPARGARDHNLALMDLGALVCTARSPACDACPVSRSCAWRAASKPITVVLAVKRERFEATSRFARGRLIEALRGTPALSENQLAGILPPAHRVQTAVYLAALERDGMVQRFGGGWSLPRQESRPPVAAG